MECVTTGSEAARASTSSTDAACTIMRFTLWRVQEGGRLKTKLGWDIDCAAMGTTGAGSNTAAGGADADETTEGPTAAATATEGGNGGVGLADGSRVGALAGGRLEDATTVVGVEDGIDARLVEEATGVGAALVVAA